MTARPPLAARWRSFRLPPAMPARLPVAAAAGALAVPAFAPFFWWPLALVSLAVLFALWRGAGSAARAFWLGYAWGLGLLCLGVPWVYVSLHEYGGMPAALAALANFLFCAFLSLYPGLAGVLAVKLGGASSARFLLVAAPAGFVLTEYLRGWVLSGFPWLSMGHSQTPGGFLPAPLGGFAPVFGAYGISWLIAVSAGLLALLSLPGSQLSARGRRVALGVLAATWLSGVILSKIDFTSPSGPPVSVALLQGNVPQGLKWREDQRQATYANYMELIAGARASLIVLPETALPSFLSAVPPEVIEGLQRAAGDAAVILGVPVSDGVQTAVPRYTNSAVTLGAASRQRYDKQHLVAFGEFVPPMFSWVFRWLNIPLGGFAEGDPGQRPMSVAGRRVAVNICYEDAFGREIARQLPEAELLVNISNMAWFGRYLAADQHAQFSQMRAMETGRWMLRATNTGLTAAIDHTGAIVRSLPQFTRGTLTIAARPRQGATPYVWWRDWPVLMLLAAVLGWSAWIRPAARG